MTAAKNLILNQNDLTSHFGSKNNSKIPSNNTVKGRKKS